MGLRARLLLLALVPTVPALLLALYTNLELRRLGAARVEKDAMKVVQLTAARSKHRMESRIVAPSDERPVNAQASLGQPFVERD